MACPSLQTGNQFLSTTLAHIDCQARSIGAYGYGALADPGSAVSIALTGLLTLFIAIFAIRLLIGHPIGAADVIGDVLKIGIVLTIASSWPAWRTVAYDLVLDGPTEVAGTIGMASGLPGSRNDMIARLQNADDGIVAMTVYGSGRLIGDVSVGTDIGDSPRGIALSDQFALGAGRTLFLTSTIGPTAIVRLGAGILLAIAPLMAGLLFFPGTAGIFYGWLRALAFCALGNVVLLIVQGAELALLYPWLGDVLQQRASRVFTPAAPTELLVIALGFSVLTAGLLYVVAKFVFMPSSARLFVRQERTSDPEPRGTYRSAAFERPAPGPDADTSRALAVSAAVAHSIQREERMGSPSRMTGSLATDRTQAAGPLTSAPGTVVGPSDVLGSSFKRSQRRSSAAANRRDSSR